MKGSQVEECLRKERGGVCKGKKRERRKKKEKAELGKTKKHERRRKRVDEKGKQWGRCNTSRNRLHILFSTGPAHQGEENTKTNQYFMLHTWTRRSVKNLLVIGIKTYRGTEVGKPARQQANRQH